MVQVHTNASNVTEVQGTLLPGTRLDENYSTKDVSAVWEGGRSEEVWTLTVGATPAADTETTLTLTDANGAVITEVVFTTPSGSPSEADVAEAAVAAIEADYLSGIYGSAKSAGAIVTFAGSKDGRAFSWASDNGDITPAQSQAASEGTSIAPGTAVALVEYDTNAMQYQAASMNGQTAAITDGTWGIVGRRLDKEGKEIGDNTLEFEPGDVLTVRVIGRVGFELASGDSITVNGDLYIGTGAGNAGGVFTQAGADRTIVPRTLGRQSNVGRQGVGVAILRLTA